jgi:hypothetical protein
MGLTVNADPGLPGLEGKPDPIVLKYYIKIFKLPLKYHKYKY